MRREESPFVLCIEMYDVSHLTLTPTIFWNPNYQGGRVRKKGLGEKSRPWRWNHHEWKQNLYKEKWETGNFFLPCKDTRRWPLANQESGSSRMSNGFSGALILDITVSRVVTDGYLLFNPMHLWCFVIAAQTRTRSYHFNSKVPTSTWSFLQYERRVCRPSLSTLILV